MQSNPEYDSYIRKLIDGAVARLVNQGDFENAIDDFTRTDSIISNTREIGIILYTEFTYAFIIAGILLLLAVVGAIAIIIPLQEKPEKSVNPKDQIMANKSNRLRLIGDESNDS